MKPRNNKGKLTYHVTARLREHGERIGVNFRERVTGCPTAARCKKRHHVILRREGKEAAREDAAR